MCRLKSRFLCRAAQSAAISGHWHAMSCLRSVSQICISRSPRQPLRILFVVLRIFHPCCSCLYAINVTMNFLKRNPLSINHQLDGFLLSEDGTCALCTYVCLSLLAVHMCWTQPRQEQISCSHNFPQEEFLSHTRSLSLSLSQPVYSLLGMHWQAVSWSGRFLHREHRCAACIRRTHTDSQELLKQKDASSSEPGGAGTGVEEDGKNGRAGSRCDRRERTAEDVRHCEETERLVRSSDKYDIHSHHKPLFWFTFIASANSGSKINCVQLCGICILKLCVQTWTV